MSQRHQVALDGLDQSSSDLGFRGGIEGALREVRESKSWKNKDRSSGTFLRDRNERRERVGCKRQQSLLSTRAHLSTQRRSEERRRH